MEWQEEPWAGVEPNISRSIVGLAGASVSCYGHVPEMCGSNLGSSRPTLVPLLLKVESLMCGISLFFFLL